MRRGPPWLWLSLLPGAACGVAGAADVEAHIDAAADDADADEREAAGDAGDASAGGDADAGDGELDGGGEVDGDGRFDGGADGDEGDSAEIPPDDGGTDDTDGGPPSGVCDDVDSPGADGRTFAERRAAWLAGPEDPTRLAPTADAAELDRRVDLLFGWLERCATDPGWVDRCRGPVVTEVIEYFVGRYWIHPGPKAQRGFAVLIALRYYGDSPYAGADRADAISREAYDAVVERYRDRVIAEGDLFLVGNPNKQVTSMVGAYAYAAWFDRDAELPFYGCTGTAGECTGADWATFEVDGRRYVRDTGPYNAYQLTRDWLVDRIEAWCPGRRSPRGNREFDSLTYARLYPEAMMLLERLAPDDDMRSRGHLCADLLLLDAVLDFSANGWGGTLGRTDYRHMDRTPRFPFRVLWGLSTEETEWDITALYALGRAASRDVVRAGILAGGWRFHREYNEELHQPGAGKWTFLTQNYNLGSDVGPRNSGWQAVVRGPDPDGFIRFWINGDAADPSDTSETGYLGDEGLQLRNALFANLGRRPYYREFAGGGAAWDEELTEGDWTFRRLGSVFVAVRLGDTGAAVELAEQGVDYPSFTAFRTAVLTTAALGPASYTTSRGAVIAGDDPCGLDEPGDCLFPFDRLETVASAGPLVEWDGDVMAVHDGERTCVYDFRTWTWASR